LGGSQALPFADRLASSAWPPGTVDVCDRCEPEPEPE
jgi:hypothetical protein